MRVMFCQTASQPEGIIQRQLMRLQSNTTLNGWF